MGRKRHMMTQKEVGALLEAREWCLKRGMDGLAGFYDELLDDAADRGRLPRMPGTDDGLSGPEEVDP